MLLCIMNVYITGGNKSLRELAHSPVDYCADKMFSENLRNKLVLDIEFSKTLYKEDGILGEIDFEDSNHKPKEFTMTVDTTVSKRRILETHCTRNGAYETVRQGRTCGSQQMRIPRWQDTLIDSETNYWDLPWEIEAHGRELGLFIRWAEANDLAKHNWTQENPK